MTPPLLERIGSRIATVKARGAPLVLDRTLGWSALVTSAYVAVVLAWGGLLGALFAAPPVAFFIVVASSALVIRRSRGAVSLRAWLLMVLTAAVGAVLLLPLLMLSGGDPYGELVGLWSVVMLPLAGLLVVTTFVVRGAMRRKRRACAESEWETGGTTPSDGGSALRNVSESRSPTATRS